jgi:rubrerythrin
MPLTEIHILEECCAIEEKCAHIYRHFSKLFSDSPDICSLWNKVASEEDHHANSFRMAIRKLKSGMADVKPCFKNINKVMSTLELIHRDVETNPPSLAGAFDLALTIEKSLAECHIDSVVKFSDSDISKLFLQMEINDQGHLKLLQEAIDSLR